MSPRSQRPTGKKAKPAPKSPRPTTLLSLPRELRDAIYDHCVTYKVKFPLQQGLRIRGRNLSWANLKRVSHQIRYEYLDRVSGKGTLVIVDRTQFAGGDEDDEKINLPNQLQGLAHVEAYIAIDCTEAHKAQVYEESCRVKVELRLHRKWLEHLTFHMQRLETISLSTYVAPHPSSKDCEKRILELQTLFTALPELRSWKVISFVFDEGALDWRFHGEKKAIMELREGNLEMIVKDENK